MDRPRFLIAALIAAFLIPTTPAAAQTTTVWAVGDGADSGTNDTLMASRIEQDGPFDKFLYLGDVYETGTAQEFADNYHPSYGRFLDKTYSSIGNHEWLNRAEGYDPYFGDHSPQNHGGHWYSFDLPGWHVVNLSTEESFNTSFIQMQWLEQDLAKYEGDCTIAMMHKPRYSAYHLDPTVPNGDRPNLENAWVSLAGRAVAVLNGHDHNYQRFEPNRGITQFTIGTGGHGWYPVDDTDTRLDAYLDDRHGEAAAALRLELNTDGTASYRLVAADGDIRDFGSFSCTPAKPHNTVAPAVTGTAERGQTLTATTGTWKGTPNITHAHQWRRCDGEACSDIQNATNSTYVEASDDVGYTLRDRVTATNDAGSDFADSAATAVVQGAPVNTARPSVSGTTVEGSTLSATTGTWRAAPAPTYGYQWLRCDDAGAGCAPIDGATGSTHGLAPADVGHSLRVVVTATNSFGAPSQDSMPTAKVSGRPPVAGQAPAITGDPAEGSTLSSSDGVWTGTAPITFTRRWLRCDGAGANCAEIPDATETTYVPVAADEGHTLRVRISASNGSGTDSSDSPQSARVKAPPRNGGAPAVSGTATDGQTLTASDGSWTGTPAPILSRAWLRCDESGAACVSTGATGVTYALSPGDVGHTIRVRVTASNSQNTAQADSPPTAKVAAIPPANSQAPAITGIATEGQTLTSSTGTWTGSTPLQTSRQWRRCDALGDDCADIDQATAATYVPTEADVGHTLRVTDTAQNSGGSDSATSDPTAVIAAAPDDPPPPPPDDPPTDPAPAAPSPPAADSPPADAPPLAPPAVDQPSSPFPVAKLVALKGSLPKFIARGLSLRINCSDPCSGGGALLAGPVIAFRLGTNPTTRATAIAKGSFTPTRPLRLRPNRAIRRRAAHLRSLRLTLEVTVGGRKSRAPVRLTR